MGIIQEQEGNDRYARAAVSTTAVVEEHLKQNTLKYLNGSRSDSTNKKCNGFINKKAIILQRQKQTSYPSKLFSRQ